MVKAQNVELLRAQWNGRRVRLTWLSDQHTRLRPGMMGTVAIVDSVGTLHVRWDNGVNLGLVPGIDEWTLIT